MMPEGIFRRMESPTNAQPEAIASTIASPLSDSDSETNPMRFVFQKYPVLSVLSHPGALLLGSEFQNLNL